MKKATTKPRADQPGTEKKLRAILKQVYALGKRIEAHRKRIDRLYGLTTQPIGR